MTREIVVSITDGGVLTLHDLAFVSPEGVFWQALPVAGGAIVTNVRAPERGLSAVIDDAAAASWWVPFVFGETAAEAVAALDGQAGAQARTVIADVPPRAALDEVAHRLLVGFWLRRWWPPRVVDATVTEWLLDAELGALAAEAESLFGGDDVAASLLAPHATVLAAEASAALKGANQPADRLDVVQRAVLAAADVLDTGIAGFGALDKAAAAIVEAGGIQFDVTEVAAALSLPQSAVLPPSALPESDNGAPVDWTSVHPRQLSPAVDAIRFGIRAEGNQYVIEVLVDAPAGWVSVPVEEGELYARVALADGVEAVPLVAVPGGFRGEGLIDDATGAVATVYSDVYGAGGRDATDPGEVMDVRRGVTEIARARLAAGVGAVPALFVFERQLMRDARRAAEIDEAVREAMAETDVDFDLELLALTVESTKTRSADASFQLKRFRATGDGFRVDVIPHARGWQVRMLSRGVEGDFEVTVRFGSGVSATVELLLLEDRSADAVIPTDRTDDPPVRVLLRRRA